MFRWRMREVLLTQDAGLFGAVQDALIEAGYLSLRLTGCRI